MFEHKILPYVIQYVPSQSIVSELYAGIGLIGMNLLPIAKEIYCSDSNPFIESVFDKMVDNLPEVCYLISLLSLLFVSYFNIYFIERTSRKNLF